MRKASTVQELLQADIAEAAARTNRFRSQSSLPRIDKLRYRPNGIKWRRDRVMRHILQLNMKKAMKDIGL